MPNQLAQSKRRQTLAEHAAVLAALSAIADKEETSVMALLRAAARSLVKERLETDISVEIRSVIWSQAPRMPAQFKTAAQVARFKRSQREFDQVLLDCQVASPASIQSSNSIASAHSVTLMDFDQAHAATR